MRLDLFSMIVGGLLVIAAIWLYHQIQAGRIKIPSLITLGPVKIDLSEVAALRPQEGIEGEDKPKRELNLNINLPKLTLGARSDTASSGWLAILGAGGVLLGFIMPWFFCNIAYISGSFSGLSALLQLAIGIVLAFFGGLAGVGNRSDGLAGLSFITLLLLLIPTAFLALVPLSAWRIGRTGYRLIQLAFKRTYELRMVSKYIIRTAVIGLVPMVCYILSASTSINFSTLSFLGLNFQAGPAQTGLWITIAGFAIAIFAGLMISSSVAQKEQQEDSSVSKLGKFEPPSSE